MYLRRVYVAAETALVAGLEPAMSRIVAPKCHNSYEVEPRGECDRQASVVCETLNPPRILDLPSTRLAGTLAVDSNPCRQTHAHTASRRLDSARHSERVAVWMCNGGCDGKAGGWRQREHWQPRDWERRDGDQGPRWRLCARCPPHLTSPHFTWKRDMAQVGAWLHRYVDTYRIRSAGG